jgi:hypothetical protein
MTNGFPHGTVHQAPADLRNAIEADAALLALWRTLTPLGRNEFICWVEDARQAATRERRIRRGRAVARRQATAVLLGRLHPPGRQGTKRMATGRSDRRQAPLS